ncbi:MAG TPA: 4-hydroxythreonine-4-phosphate dehydrogenase PdxA [Terriglobia bacterium]|nr:4-hydroxythreonine-4-phosphate dehydrogenase PdxA [Terriglobia bacterium]
MLRVFAVTTGDPSGVGPEILLKAFCREEIRYPIVVYGDLEALEFYDDLLKYGVPLRKVNAATDYQPGYVNVISAGIVRRSDITVGKLNKQSGLAAREYVVAATRATLGGETAAIVTLPMNKEATQLSDPGFTGHTELIGELCGAKDVTIMLVSDELIVTHVSTHVSLSTAIARAKRERIQSIIRLTQEAVQKLKLNPRIAVAGLNPHAGENGLFGDEEIREIRPAVEWARSQGWHVEGPLPPDTVFYLAVRKKAYDAVVCMYHDQGHIPSKLLDFEGGVNVTLGLPIVRTSVDHGTAFDIAGQGKASTVSFIRALDFAARLTSSNAGHSG